MCSTRTFAVIFQLLFALAVLMGGVRLSAQACPTTSASSDLICVIPQLYGPNGLILPNVNHAAHFRSASLQSFSPLNTAIGQELSTLPIASPASGIVFTFDPSLGVMSRSTTSFGPIFTDRADTIVR